jgi:hypothetical protein
MALESRQSRRRWSEPQPRNTSAQQFPSRRVNVHAVHTVALGGRRVNQVRFVTLSEGLPSR